SRQSVPGQATSPLALAPAVSTTWSVPMSPEPLPLCRSSCWPRRLASHLRGPLAALLCAAPLAFAAPVIESARFERLTQQLEAEVEQGHLAGIAVLVADRDNILYRHNAGFADVAAGSALADDSI